MAVGEWDQRQLCSDGGCVGIIGPDGTCKVCGRAAQNWGDERKRGLIEPADDEVAAAEHEDDEEDDEVDDQGADQLDDDEVEDDGVDDLHDEDDEEEDEDEDDAEDGDGIAASTSAPALAAAPPDWGTRRLCPDGSCIGLIGDDGRCKVCGRQAPGNFQTTASGTADSGFAIETTETAVSTTDDAVQTVASTVTAGEPTSEPPDDAAAPDPADPDSKEPIR